ncbi:hypothetical protein FDP41_012214 [Naegleria fowleri]|uniref:Uncharacterized protein n=1 Tax=Naegleria fowleri TaxID=5763 RepID=A0A6A5BWC6_NAEFO|nr:uncharacterized protein FDP41_012214 [Naegleria fowleri]KAF0981557.1 hypothetical protein FDP41_012214 [Naegleria fowleri]
MSDLYFNLRMASKQFERQRVKQAEMMNTVAKTLGSVVKGLDKALETLDTEKIGVIMDKFEQQVGDMDVTVQHMESSINTVTSTITPEDEVNSLMAQVIDENNMDLDQTLSLAKVGKDAISEIQAESLKKEVEKQREKKKAVLL